VVPWDGDDEARIVLISLVEIRAILVGVAGEVDHVSEVVKECRLFVGRRFLSILSHHFRDEILLLAAVVACVPTVWKTIAPAFLISIMSAAVSN